MALKKGIKQLLAEAEHKAPGIAVEEARSSLDDANTVFVDIRDVRELEREGTVPGCVNAPRGMLEFWVDPASPYYKPVFGDEGKDIRAYFVSVDPERDTPEIMQSYVGNVSDRIIGLTGEPDKVAANVKRHLGHKTSALEERDNTRWSHATKEIDRILKDGKQFVPPPPVAQKPMER